MSDREELDKLHVDEPGARAQRQRITVAAHISRRAVAAKRRVSPPVATIVAFAERTTPGTGTQVNRDGARYLPVTPIRSTTQMSPALRMRLARLMTVRSVFETAGPVLRKST